MLSATPIITAYCSGTSKVAMNVATMASRGMRPVFHVITACSVRRPWKPATISSAASAGIGTRSTSGAANSTISTTKNPTKMLPQRDLAPALTRSAVPDTEPPAGMPPTRLVAMLAAPWPRKSRDTSA